MGAGDARVAIAVDDEGVATLHLDDPEHRNVLSLDMTNALVDAAADVVARRARALVLSAAPPVFCAGGSVDDLFTPRAPLEAMYRGFAAIAALPIPSVAAVDGAVLGAGINLALACDVVLCTPRARFDVRFLDLGLHPGGGLLWRLRGLAGPQATAAMALFGEALDGPAAARLGLAWRCLPEEEVVPEAMRLARRAASRDPALNRRVKETLAAAPAVRGADEATAVELEAQRWSMAQPAFHEALAGLRARLGRPPASGQGNPGPG